MYCHRRTTPNQSTFPCNHMRDKIDRISTLWVHENYSEHFLTLFHLFNYYWNESTEYEQEKKMKNIITRLSIINSSFDEENICFQFPDLNWLSGEKKKLFYFHWDYYLYSEFILQNDCLVQSTSLRLVQSMLCYVRAPHLPMWDIKYLNLKYQKHKIS